MQQPNQQPYGYPAQQPMPQGQPVQRPQQQQAATEVRFYKSSLLGIGSAPGRFQRDFNHMAAQGWRLRSVSNIGTDLFLRRYVVAIYER